MCILGAIPVMCGVLHCIAKSEDVCYMTCRALVPKLSKIACVPYFLQIALEIDC